MRGGILEIMSEGIGFLRSARYSISEDDVYVSQAQLRRYELRSGDLVIGHVRPPRESERHWGLVKVESVNGVDPEEARHRPRFEDQTPIFPDKRFDLETERDILATRLINLVTPIGRGQRGLIVSPPKAGKTTILKQIANGISMQYPDVHLMVALIGERPEEVTDMDRSVDAEVIASTFDEPVTSHVRTAEIALDRAKRLTEIGRHVVILMDSITRLARAYNLVVNPSGRTLSGGMDPSALYPPKHFFGAARNLEEGGSLTIIATCLVDTGSRLDDVVYEEFKGTGNMELHLSRKLQERRIFPAVDIERSSTRREDLLLGPDILQRVWTMRRMYIQMVSAPPAGCRHGLGGGHRSHAAAHCQDQEQSGIPGDTYGRLMKLIGKITALTAPRGRVLVGADPAACRHAGRPGSLAPGTDASRGCAGTHRNGPGPAGHAAGTAQQRAWRAGHRPPGSAQDRDRPHGHLRDFPLHSPARGFGVQDRRRSQHQARDPPVGELRDPAGQPGQHPRRPGVQHPAGGRHLLSMAGGGHAAVHRGGVRGRSGCDPQLAGECDRPDQPDC